MNSHMFSFIIGQEGLGQLSRSISLQNFAQLPMMGIEDKNEIYS